MNKELIFYFVLVVVVFSATFLLVSKPNSNSQVISNVTVYSSGNPLALGKKILGNGSIILQDRLFTGNDSRNSAVAIASAQIALADKIFNHFTSTYGVVENKTIGCNENNSQCGYPQIVVEVGDCNCVNISSSQVVFDGSSSFLQSNAVNFGNVVAAIFQS